MSVKLIQERLNSYNCKSELEEEHAIREITQEVALAALSRTDFFKYGIFQGGTCLRIFYGLNRFSEDLDFILKEPNRNFKLQPHLQSLSEELQAYGYNVDITDRSKTDIAVRKAFIKDDSIGKVLQLNHAGKKGPFRKIRIKLEVDTNPPSGSETEIKYLDFPFVSSVTVQNFFAENISKAGTGMISCGIQVSGLKSTIGFLHPLSNSKVHGRGRILMSI
jgi:predicted nucleotidyltransferase component of viral defense system